MFQTVSKDITELTKRKRKNQRIYRCDYEHIACIDENKDSQDIKTKGGSVITFVKCGNSSKWRIAFSCGIRYNEYISVSHH